MASLTAEQKQEILDGYSRVPLIEIPIVTALPAGETVFMLALIAFALRQIPPRPRPSNMPGRATYPATAVSCVCLPSLVC